MPTPIGHALAGIAVAGVCGGRQLPKTQLAALAFCAAAPDLDLLLRLVDGANHHRGPSHSFGAAVLVGVAAFLLRRLGGSLPSGLMVGVAWASHVVLDYLGLDTSPPIGEMALWPFSTTFFASPIPVFYDVPRALTWAATRHNALAVLIELVVLVPIAALCWRRRLFTRQRES
jgi:inner membrane protein